MTGTPSHAASQCAGNPDASPACAGEESALVRSLFIVHNMMMRVGDRLTAPIGLTSSRWLLLCALGRRSEPPTIRQLSDDAMLSAQNVSRMLASMEAEGLVERRTEPGSGRALFVQLTDRGLAALAQTQALARRFEESFLRGVNPQDVEACDGLLQRLIANLEDFERALAADTRTDVATSETSP